MRLNELHSSKNANKTNEQCNGTKINEPKIKTKLKLA